MTKGKVFLVGAGPGDVGLITVKGIEAIKQAEVILYDRLANPKLLEAASANCELIYCGKLPDRHFLRQENINEFLVEKALEGKQVVRLKGGDPGVFGRVGEEAEALAEAQIPFEIVPGISSGIAAPLYAGIPVTHRKYAESFAVVTAHDKSQDGKPLLHWEGLARGIDTIAFYMGVGNLPFICENLLKHGKPAETPVILIQWGTFGRQKVLEGTLSDIAMKVQEARFSNPSIILVGKVISLREKISWFEKKPLYGRQILLARTGESKSELAAVLMDLGADVIEFPKWKKTFLPIDQALVSKIPDYEMILFTSPENVGEFFAAIIDNGIDIRKVKADLYGGSVKTIKALNDRGLTAHLAAQMPETGSLLLVGENHLFKTTFPYDSFDMMITSKKELDPQFFPIFKRMLEEADVNTMIFPCKAAVAPFVAGLTECSIDAEVLLKDVPIICMGQQTWTEVERAGFTPGGMPAKATRAALIEYLTINEPGLR
ncbi:uroporphyrinogen-III C-methyltransferase [Bacillus sp. EB600]|uniref:uroporphyrinogen-III C-methyltransferase n=1 Tax=Bacillus sp. EB600 TaxID=2806345 RepID=UPI00210A2457|nr:uroporphyrinogen-III C-methyltransferase [Bacillus sp. EB600]MCQ6280520.1 uroporphyrinogen-III C-methyltransferase [Bacillus sp. EB600]